MLQAFNSRTLFKTLSMDGRRSENYREMTGWPAPNLLFSWSCSCFKSMLGTFFFSISLFPQRVWEARAGAFDFVFSETGWESIGVMVLTPDAYMGGGQWYLAHTSASHNCFNNRWRWAPHFFCPSGFNNHLGGSGADFHWCLPIVGSSGSLLLWILLPSQWIPMEPSFSAPAHLDPHFNPLSFQSQARVSDPDFVRQLKVPWPQNMYCFVPSFKTLCFHQLASGRLSVNLKVWQVSTRNSGKSTISKTPLAITQRPITHIFLREISHWGHNK